MKSLSRNWTVQILWITLFNATFIFAGNVCVTRLVGGKFVKYCQNAKNVKPVVLRGLKEKASTERATNVATTAAPNIDSDTTSQVTPTDAETKIPSATENAAISVTTASLSYGNVSASCDGVNILNGTSGTISSPYYPSYYQHYANCLWEISVPDGMVIAVKSAATFAVETSTTCAYDAITFDNDMTVCGHDVFPSFRTDNNQLRVTFTSDYSVNDRGFLISWEAVDNSSIPSPYASNVSANHGTISSPNYPTGYDNFLDYTWIIRAPESGWFQPAISIEFKPLFDLEGVAGKICPYDSLTISTGSQPPTDEVEKVVLCDSTQPSKLVIKGSELYVSFKTDNSINGAGFSFNFTAFDSCEGGDCYWTHYETGVYNLSYEQAQEICESRDSVLAVVPNEEAYQAIIKDLWSKFPENYVFVYTWVGMTFNTTSNMPIPEDAYYLWKPGFPLVSDDRASGIFIRISKNKDSSQGMINYNPAWFNPDGVACWRPPIKADNTTPNYGYGTSEPTSDRG